MSYARKLYILSALSRDVDDDTTVGNLLEALQDGEYLASRHIYDRDKDDVDDIYDRLLGNRAFDAILALESVEGRLKDERENVYLITKYGATVEIECLSKADFRDKYGICGTYDNWRAAGGQIDDVFDCTKDEAIALFDQWLKDDEISYQCNRACCNTVMHGARWINRIER